MDLNGFACSFHQKLHTLCHTHESHMVFIETSYSVVGRIAKFSKKVFQLIQHSKSLSIFLKLSLHTTLSGTGDARTHTFLLLIATSKL